MPHPYPGKLEQDLRTAREDRDAVVTSMYTTPLERAQAQADFYAAIRRVVDADVFTLQEIADTLQMTRQRVWQIVRTPRTALPPPLTTDVQLPKEDL